MKKNIFDIATGETIQVDMTEEEINELQSFANLTKTYPTLTSRQFWLAAFSIGITKQSLIDAINQSNETDKEWLIIELSESTSFERTNPAIEVFSSLVGVPDEQLDTLWNWAANL